MLPLIICRHTSCNPDAPSVQMSGFAGAGYGTENVDPQATMTVRQSAPSGFRPIGKQPKAFGSTALPAPAASKDVQDSSSAHLSSAKNTADTEEAYHDAPEALGHGGPLYSLIADRCYASHAEGVRANQVNF